MIPDILINDTSMLKLGWIREIIDFPIPKSQAETVTVPGRNSPIRFNEALGLVSFEPRAFTLTFSMLVTRVQFDELVSKVSNRYAGRLCQIICSEEPNLYVLGTIEMSSSYDPLTGKGQLVMESSDADSYRYHVEETQVVFTGSGTAVLVSDYMPVVPTVITTAETTMSWKIGTDTFRRTLSSGTWEIPELQLSFGDNSIKIESDGSTTFRYREGCL